MNDQKTLERGIVLNSRYRVVDLLGRGGMSNVYLVEDVKLQSRWAMKEMLDLFPAEEKEQILEQFRKEARILAGIRHPSLPRVFDYFEEKGRHYLVMEYIRGRNLREILDESGPVPPESLLNWAVQICEVLETLHGEGIVYRDLKPDNLLVDRENRICLIDFGIARLFTGGKLHDTVIIGTPGFASPEHHGRAETDSRSDIYSLGATLHYLATGADPQLLPFVFKEPCDLVKGFPDHFSRCIMKALSLNPAERYQTAGEMKKDLKKVPPERDVTVQLPGMSENLEGRDYKPSRRAHATRLIGTEKFQTDYVKIYAGTFAFSGGIMLGSLLLLTGGIINPAPLLWSLVGTVPLSLMMEKLYRYVFRSPGDIFISADEKGIRMVRGEMNLVIPWEEVMGFLVFQEKSRLSFPVTRYKLFTRRGNIEYGADVSRVEELNGIIIDMAQLRLIGESGEYRRYDRSAPPGKFD